MLKFISMEINNFGPYKGCQIIDFTNRDGVTIFWGDNGRGKTTLLNAFRYALFGTIARRKGVLRSLKEMENLEGRNEGIYGFEIILKMENDGNKYELTRQFRKRDDVAVPSKEDDYEKKMFLKENGAFLNEKEATHKLNIIMPEQVSRFFLFDGELLQEYEELLENDTTTGDKIKNAIEKILGVPVLTNGRDDLNIVLQSLEKEKEKIYAKDAKGKQFASQLEAISARIEEHNLKIQELTTLLDQLVKQKIELTDQSENTAQVRQWLDSQNNLEKDKSDTEESIKNLTQQICNITQTCWEGMLLDIVSIQKNNLKERIEELESKKQHKAIADRFLSDMKKACNDGVCPVCQQDVTGVYLDKLKDAINKAEDTYAGLNTEEREELLTLQSTLATISSYKLESRKQELSILEENLAAQKIKLDTINTELSNVKSKITKYGDVSNVGSITERLAKVFSKIDNTKDGIEKEKAALDEDKTNKDKIQAQILKASSEEETISASKKVSVCKKIFDIFEKGMTEYRDLLKENVQNDASSLFRELSSDKDYVGLLINSNYGLSIQHKSGNLVPGRSSGFEHIVALSLIGALHKNAPLQGPIIMDSPFGRLDPTHKKNIVQQLPKMASQTMLLMYDGEIDRDMVTEALAGSLLQEYKLKKITSMYTMVE